ncbi:methionyl aminopeptidase [Fonticula alba]|uniref:Methionine aminopeptidase 2 n=1 Tax=Fonticula alba TaxID=691883 RepID=A0A058Z781_FONAL|nr:methionyl aminopeptidase [Fonticula alba]KCV70149.1 methionyl aminopeptidase [Fonticula alba]|eukprot:XP_009495755.1 methionyl aminopeptidase [Fonticula alba]
MSNNIAEKPPVPAALAKLGKRPAAGGKVRRPASKPAKSEPKENQVIASITSATPVHVELPEDFPFKLDVPTVSEQFKEVYPVGEEVEYANDTTQRITSEEMREKERLEANIYNDVRRAAEVHRQVRKHVRANTRPGMAMVDIANMVENNVRRLIEADGFKAGIAFPTGLSLNHVAAHWTPNPGDKTILKETDIVKIDFGTHVNGRIIDSAFTLSFDPTHDPLITACREATNAGIREAGIDVRMCDIGAAIQEVMESYEVTIGNKVYPVKPIRNLNGHSIESYQIHAGKTVPIVKGGDHTRMEEGEFYAIETFGSTGRGYVVEDSEVSHWMRSPHMSLRNNIRVPRAAQLMNTIDMNFGSLAFCNRYLERIGEENFAGTLRSLAQTGAIEAYPPLVESRGSLTAQSEHTILLRPTCKEIISRGDDY